MCTAKPRPLRTHFVPRWTAFAALLCACTEADTDAPEMTGEGENPAVLVAAQMFAPDAYLTYVELFPEVPEGDVDLGGFREFGNANAYSFGGRVFVEVDGRVKRFSVNEAL